MYFHLSSHSSLVIVSLILDICCLTTATSNEELSKGVLTATPNRASRGLECQLRAGGIDIV